MIIIYRGRCPDSDEGLVAQWIERRRPKAGVAGSNPAQVTNYLCSKLLVNSLVFK